jgi:hypothetical protein
MQVLGLDSKVGSAPNKERLAYVCSHFFAHARPVLLVSHAGGNWQFLCGAVHTDEVPRVIGINHVFEQDSTLTEVMDLPADWEAERAAADGAWTRTEVGASS